MQQTGCGGTGRWATLLAAVHLDGRRRLAACAVAGAAALLAGISGVAAHGDAPAGARGHGRTAAVEHVSTSVQSVGRPGDDRGNGDDQTPAPGEHGNPHRFSIGLVVPTVAPEPTPNPHGLRLGSSGGSTPAPAPVPPVTGPRPAAPTTTSIAPTALTATPPRTAPAPGGGTPPSTPAQPPKPQATLPPLVLIPPLGLPTPPSINAVVGGSGVVPLVVVLLAMATLSVILGLRLARRSR